MVNLTEQCQALRIRTHEGVPVVNSRDVAEKFGKEHKNVLRDIEAIRSTRSNLSALNWFIETTYVDPKGETRRAFDITRQGFMLLVMGWTGPKAMDIKVLYIETFEAMEAALKSGAVEDHRLVLAVREAMREVVAPLTVRFAAQDDQIGRIEKRVDVIHDDLQALKFQVVNNRRKNISSTTRAELNDATRLMGGKCPNCRTASVICDDGSRSPFAEYDHFYQNSRADPDHVWLICKPCHAELTTGRVSRHEREAEFRAFQQARRRLPGRQRSLFG
ncbi:Rha family transcriptional regulator [Alsobacter sp. R-9]